MFTVSDAFMLSVGHVPVTVTGTVPGVFGAVHAVFCCAGLANEPVGALHSYVTTHPIESCAVAVSLEVPPTSTVHGLHCASTVSVCCGAGAVTGGGGGGGSATGIPATPGW